MAIKKPKQKFDKESGLLSLNTAQKYIETVTDNAGLEVRFDPRATAPCTNKNTLIIPSFTGEVTQKDLKKLRWWVLHESLHHTKGPEAFNIGEKELGFDARHSPLAAIWNIFEDNRIEKAGSKDYRGDKMILDDGWRTLLEQDKDDIEHVLKNASGEMLKVGAAWYANLKTRSDWSPAAVEMEAQFEKLMPQEMKDLVKKLEDKGVIRELGDLREDKLGSRNSFNLAKRTYEILFEGSADEHIKQKQKERKAQEKQQQQGKGDDKNTSSKSSDSGQGASKSGKSEGDSKKPGKGTEEQPGDKPSNSSGTGGKDGKNDGSGEVPSSVGNKLAPPSNEGESCKLPTGETVSYEVFVSSEHVDPKAPGGTGIQLDYTEHKKKAFNNDYIPTDNVHWIRYRTNTFSHEHLKGHEQINAYNKEYKLNTINAHHTAEGVPGKGFGNKIRQLLQIKSQAHYQGGKKKGKLHMKNVYRACLPIDSYNERIFRQKTQSDTLDTCVTVLTDLSGSMDGAKFLNAVDSSLLLNTSIARSLRIPVEILAFTEYGADTFIGIVKEYDEPISDDKIIENFARASMFMSANADGDAILWAYDRLKQRQQKRKILIVISDGSPAASRNGDAYGFTKKVVSQIEGEKLVEIYAIGIMNPNVQDIYSESVVINRPNELETAVLTLIKKSVFK